MTRAGIIAAAKPLTPITIGTNPVGFGIAGGWGGGGSLHVLFSNPATIDGILDTVKVLVNSTGTFYAVVLQFLSGNDYKIRSSSGSLTATGTGVQTFTGLNMDVKNGDSMGIWLPSSGQIGISYGGFGSIAYSGTVAPVVGATHTLAGGWGAELPVQGLGFG